MTQDQHIPVLLSQVLEYLNPQPGKHYIDGTLGGAGHTKAILAATEPTGYVLGLDRDPKALERLDALEQQYRGRLILRNASYDETAKTIRSLGWNDIDGALLDLGLSSIQLDDSNRGFGFRFDSPLDLRFDQSQGETAAEMLASVSEAELATILFRYGELYNSRGLAKRIINYRRSFPLEKTADLITATGLKHPRRLAQLFQAIRIAVNDELDIVATGLADIWSVIGSGGRLVVLSFHSLEDRIVKDQFRRWAQGGEGTLLTKRPVVADESEQRTNPRARSAKLRAIEKN